MLPTSPSGGGFRTLIHNRPFLALWIGQILSQIADKVFFVLMISLLTQYRPLPGLENSARSLLMIAFTLPAILLGSAAGIVVDRFSKKQILTYSNFLRGLLVLSIPVLPKVFLVLLVITFLESILTQFFAPAEQTAIPLLVERQGLMTANALFTTTMLGSLIVGFAIGEPLLSLARTWGQFGEEFLVSVLYLLAAGVIWSIPMRETQYPEQQVKMHPWNDFKSGLKYLRQDRLVSNAMLQLAILYSVFAALVGLSIPLVKDLGLKDEQFGFLLAAAGIGIVLGSAVLGHWGDRFHHKPLPLIGFLMMAIGLSVFTFVDSIWVGLGLSTFLGIGASLVGVPMQTLIQQQTPESMRGKIFGFQNNLVNIALILPLAIATSLTDAVGLRAVLIGMSIIIIVIGIWAWKSTRNVLQDVI
ncbi:MAG: MFS transporter [Scytolyngbya sp. HA4215-MV1]|jgi:MFS family permease|nr:MFS transporter [Scytolyngbya sp. HA4215-MV1]